MTGRSVAEVLVGDEAPPRTNGELVFDEPWQMRAFGLTAELVDAGTFTWDQFREQLIASIDRWNDDGSGEWVYYERWAEALEASITNAGALDAALIDGRSHEFAHRPHGHDH